MGLDDQELVDPSSVPAALRCSICADVFEDPVDTGGTPCLHVFCRPCLEPALRLKAACPICRQPMQRQQLKQSQVVGSILDEVQVRCMSRCGWTGRRDAHSGHVAACPTRLLQETRQQLEVADRERDQTRQQLEVANRERDEAKMRLRNVARELDEARERLHRSNEGREGAERQFQEAERMTAELRRQLAQARQERDEAKAQMASHQAKRVRETLELIKVRIRDTIGDSRDAELLAFEEEVASCVAKRQHVDTQDVGQLTRFVPPALPQQGATPDMQMFVKTLRGKTITIYVQPLDSIRMIKSFIQEKEGVPCDAYSLTFQEKRLDDHRNIFDYGIARDSTIWMRGRLGSRSIPHDKDDDHTTKTTTTTPFAFAQDRVGWGPLGAKPKVTFTEATFGFGPQGSPASSILGQRRMAPKPRGPL
mmetsp:Transcript_6652/g.24854  ORF Transcript_6652/g.24854 Transcript_6652/m.24854 type:complete len:422 (-) Transcript_6652:235-1500(-)